MSFENLVPNEDFYYSISFRNNEIMLDVNFTKDNDGNQTMNVEPIVFPHEFDPDSGLPGFILGAKPYVLQVPGKQKESAWLINMSRLSSKVFNWTVEIVGWISLVTCIGLLFFNVDMTRPMLDFLRIVKPISRFKYINIYYGGIVEIFLTQYKNIYHLIADERDDEIEQFFVDTRGSLRRFYIPVLTFTTIPDKYIFYIVSPRSPRHSYSSNYSRPNYTSTPRREST